MNADASPAPRDYTGMIEGMPNDEYHASPGISKSHLDVIGGKSNRHYWEKYLNPNRQPEKQTPAKVLGTAIHAAVLEPDIFTSGYVPNPGIERRSNAGKAEYAAFVLENEGRVILTDDDYQTCLHIRDGVRRHPLARGLLTGGKAEQSFYALEEDEGEKIKCRLDYFREGEGLVADVKSTEDASPAGFGKSAWNYRYILQPPWYFRVLETLYGEAPRQWAFLAFEKYPPYAVGVYYLTAEQMALGNELAMADYHRLVALKRAAAEALRLGDDPFETVWTDYGTEPRPLMLPGWAKTR